MRDATHVHPHPPIPQPPLQHVLALFIRLIDVPFLPGFTVPCHLSESPHQSMNQHETTSMSPHSFQAIAPPSESCGNCSGEYASVCMLLPCSCSAHARYLHDLPAQQNGVECCDSACALVSHMEGKTRLHSSNSTTQPVVRVAIQEDSIRGMSHSTRLRESCSKSENSPAAVICRPAPGPCSTTARTRELTAKGGSASVLQGD